MNRKDHQAGKSDADLVQAARDGDKRAFVHIVARHQGMVCGIALGVLGELTASEDAAQEAFLIAWRRINDLRQPERLRAWLGQIARNAALGQLRRRRPHDPLEQAPVLRDESPTPDEMAAHQEEAELVQTLLARLPESYRTPLVLYYRDGQSVRAVAEALDISQDAVKQRLARGREMLRERMSGLVETVLTRTRPSTIFTMTVAAAIGALAAPAAVAGGVFSAGSGYALLSAAPSASTTLLTAMSTSKGILLTAMIVAAICVPVGYYIEGGHGPAESLSAAARPAGPALGRSAELVGDSPLVAEWRRLHQKFGSTARAMPALYKAISDINDPFRRRGLRTALIAEWVQIDPAGGLAFFAGNGTDDQQRRQFLEEWLAHDPTAAVNALLSTGPGWGEAARACLSEIARRVPSRLGEVASHLPKPESYYERQVRDAFAIVAERDLDSARQAAAAVTGASRQEALGGVARVWARRDFDAVTQWAKSLSDQVDRDELIRDALLGKAGADPAGAMERVGMVPLGGRYAHGESTTGARVIIEAANADFDGTLAWLAAHPGQFGREELMGLSQQVTEQLNARPLDFLNAHAADGSLQVLLPAIESAILNNASGQSATVWEWLKDQPAEDESIRKIKNEVLNAAGYAEPGLALKLSEDLPSNAEGDEQMKRLARSLLNGGQLFYRLDALLNEAPDRLRQTLIQTAFDVLYPDTLSDPHLWIGRLALLPAEARPHAIESVARAWAGQAPEEAIAWAASIPEGDSRTAAVAAIAASWAKKDAPGASEWVGALPPGLERDRTAQSLMETIASRYPEEAWKWAMSIQDNASRQAAAAEAARAMAARDPARAQSWIEQGSFTAEVKAELRTKLAKRE